jgi:hypothetical protein
LGIDLFKSVLMYSNGAICLIKLLFDLGLFTVWLKHFRPSNRHKRHISGILGQCTWYIQCTGIEALCLSTAGPCVDTSGP